MPDYFVQEEDGTSRIALEEADGFLILEEAADTIISSVGSLGTASTKTSGTTLGISPTSTVPAGNLVGLWWVWDSDTALGETFGNYYPRWAASDTAGNLWTSLMSRAQGINHTAAGFMISLLRNDLTTSDTVTVSCQIAGKTYKAISMWEWEIDPGYGWAIVNNSGNDAFLSDPASISVGSLPSREHLMIHVLGQRGPSTDTFTLDSDYTEITKGGTTGGADTSNGTITGGFRIETLTSDSINVSSDTADRDYAQGLIAITPVLLNLNFPTVPIHDDFNRADENPLDGGGLWSTAAAIPTFANKAQILSNVAAPTGGTHGGQWALPTVSSDDCEIYATFPELDGGSQGVGLIMHGSGSGPAHTRGGYEITWLPVTFGFTVMDHIDYGPAGNDTGVQTPFGRLWITQSDGNKMGIQRLSSFMHIWVDEGSGWEWVGAWYPIAGGDPTSGLAGFEILDGTNRMDDFAYGTPILAARFRVIIID